MLNPSLRGCRSSSTSTPYAVFNFLGTSSLLLGACMKHVAGLGWKMLRHVDSAPALPHWKVIHTFRTM